MLAEPSQQTAGPAAPVQTPTADPQLPRANMTLENLPPYTTIKYGQNGEQGKEFPINHRADLGRVTDISTLLNTRLGWDPVSVCEVSYSDASGNVTKRTLVIRYEEIAGSADRYTGKAKLRAVDASYYAPGALERGESAERTYPLWNKEQGDAPGKALYDEAKARKDLPVPPYPAIPAADTAKVSVPDRAGSQPVYYLPYDDGQGHKLPIYNDAVLGELYAAPKQISSHDVVQFSNGTVRHVARYEVLYQTPDQKQRGEATRREFHVQLARAPKGVVGWSIMRTKLEGNTFTPEWGFTANEINALYAKAADDVKRDSAPGAPPAQLSEADKRAFTQRTAAFFTAGGDAARALCNTTGKNGLETIAFLAPDEGGKGHCWMRNGDRAIVEGSTGSFDQQIQHAVGEAAKLCGRGSGEREAITRPIMYKGADPNVAAGGFLFPGENHSGVPGLYFFGARSLAGTPAVGIDVANGYYACARDNQLNGGAEGGLTCGKWIVVRGENAPPQDPALTGPKGREVFQVRLRRDGYMELWYNSGSYIFDPKKITESKGAHSGLIPARWDSSAKQMVPLGR